MNQTEVAKRLSEVTEGRTYSGSLTDYAAQSIEQAKSNYPVSNLIQYCSDMDIQMVMIDETTEDKFYPTSVLEVHSILKLIMKRYQISPQLIFRKTGNYYTPPKSFDLEELKQIEASGKRYTASLSIKILLAVCDVIHCNLIFVRSDESSVII